MPVLLVVYSAESLTALAMFDSDLWVAILLLLQNSDITPWLAWLDRKSRSSFSYRLAPTKFVPWSLQRSKGYPRLARNRRSAAIKASVVRSDTSSR